MGSASGGSRMKSRLRHLFHGLAIDARWSAPTVITNGRSCLVSQGSCSTASRLMCLLGQDARQLGDDSRPVVHAEAQVIRALLQRDGDRLVLAQPFVREGRDALRAAAANLARHPHQVAHHGHAGRDAPAPRP